MHSVNHFQEKNRKNQNTFLSKISYNKVSHSTIFLVIFINYNLYNVRRMSDLWKVEWCCLYLLRWEKDVIYMYVCNFCSIYHCKLVLNIRF